MDANVVAITVNYRTSQLTIELIASIVKAGSILRLIIVDNFSEDNSVETIQTYLTDNEIHWVTLIPSLSNKGFSAGNNIAFRYINEFEWNYDYLWLLNPDTRIFDSSAENLVKFMIASNYQICGSRLEDEDGTPQISAFNFPSVIGEFCAGARVGFLDRLLRTKITRTPIAESNTQCGWLAGASLMFSRKAHMSIGMMDEDYFLYFEEVDYLLKAKREGYSCWYIPSSRVYHSVGASTGISDYRKKSPRRPKYWFDSRRRYFLKNYGRLMLVFVDVAFIFGYSAWVLRKILADKSSLKNEPEKFLGDFIKNSFLFRGFSR